MPPCRWVPLPSAARSTTNSSKRATTGIELFHGYTYSDHPLACAAAIATLDVYRDEGLFDRANALHSYWEDAVHSLKSARNVIDLRNIGLIAGIEFAARAGAPGKRAMEIFHACFDDGLLVRATGDISALSPPLIFETYHIDEIFGKLATNIETID
jgi:beta-alanine--pyruvate transaminase